MDLELVKIFVKVIQFNSFSKAGENLKLPKSTISKAVTKLELETQTKLLVRTTRSLTLTPAGKKFYETSAPLIQQLEEAHKNLYGHDKTVTGHLKITAPEDLGAFVISPAIAKLSNQLPELSFELEYTNKIVDLVKEGFDLAIRLGKLNESNFKVKRVGEIYLVLVASPAYLKKHEKIRSPEDLKNHICLSYNATSLKDKWTLKSSKKTSKIQIKSNISSNQMSSLLMLARSGAGVALVPHYLCKEYVDSKELVHLLPDWRSPSFTVSIITPLPSNSSYRLKVTVEHLQKSLSAAVI